MHNRNKQRNTTNKVSPLSANDSRNEFHPVSTAAELKQAKAEFRKQYEANEKRYAREHKKWEQYHRKLELEIKKDKERVRKVEAAFAKMERECPELLAEYRKRFAKAYKAA